MGGTAYKFRLIEAEYEICDGVENQRKYRGIGGDGWERGGDSF